VFVCLFCLFFVCTVTNFSAAVKDSGVKLRMLVRLYTISHFDGLWLAWIHSCGITSGMSYIQIAVGQSELGAVARWTVGIGGAGLVRPYGGICVLQA